jgi:hypothetical protein
LGCDEDDDEEASAVGGGGGSPIGVSTKELLMEAAWMNICRSMLLFFGLILVGCVVESEKNLMWFWTARR